MQLGDKCLIEIPRFEVLSNYKFLHFGIHWSPNHATKHSVNLFCFLLAARVSPGLCH